MPHPDLLVLGLVALLSFGLSYIGSSVGLVFGQLRLPILGGALLVSLHLLSEYGAFAMIRFDTFTTAIMAQYRASFRPSESLAAPHAMLAVTAVCGADDAEADA